MKHLITALAIFCLFAACTENTRAKNFGGKGELILPQGQKLITVTWKETNLWYLTRPMSSIDSAQTYLFKESSSWGTWEGEFIIKEQK